MTNKGNKTTSSKGSSKPKYMYIVRKYVLATSFSDAVKKERSTPIHDCWLEDNSQKQMIDNELVKNLPTVGFVDNK